MGSWGVLALALALGAGANDDRLLLCRSEVAGDPVRARPEVVAQAAATFRGRFLEYGAICHDAGEGARAARRAGLQHAVVSRAEGIEGAARLELVLADAEGEAVRARRSLELAAGADALQPTRRALKELLATLPPPPGPDPQHVAAWTVAGAGAAAVVAGAVFATQARAARLRADRAGDPAAYTRAHRQARDAQRRAAWSAGLGGAAVAAGLCWRFVF
jgi:hypothetical protein